MAAALDYYSAIADKPPTGQDNFNQQLNPVPTQENPVSVGVLDNVRVPSGKPAPSQGFALQDETNKVGYNVNDYLGVIDNTLASSVSNVKANGQSAMDTVNQLAYTPDTAGTYMDTLNSVLDSNSPVLKQLGYTAGADASARGFGRSTVATDVATKAILEGASKLAASEVASQQFNVTEANKAMSDIFGKQVDITKATMQDLNTMYGKAMDAGNKMAAQQIADIYGMKKLGLENQNRISTANIQAAANMYSADKSAAASMYSSDKSAAASMYSADKSAAANMYGSDQRLAGTVHSNNQRRDEAAALLQANINGKDQSTLSDLTANHNQRLAAIEANSGGRSVKKQQELIQQEQEKYYTSINVLGVQAGYQGNYSDYIGVKKNVTFPGKDTGGTNSDTTGNFSNASSASTAGVNLTPDNISGYMPNSTPHEVNVASQVITNIKNASQKLIDNPDSSKGIKAIANGAPGYVSKLIINHSDNPLVKEALLEYNSKNIVSRKDWYDAYTALKNKVHFAVVEQAPGRGRD